MKQEIFDWYASKHLEAHKQIRINLNGGLSKHQVEAALEYCYNKIVNEGKKIQDCEISRYVRSVAIDIDTTGIIEDHRLIENAKAVVAEVRDELADERKKSTDLKKKHINELNNLSILLSENKDKVIESESKIKTLKKIVMGLGKTVGSERSESQNAKSDLAEIKVTARKALSNHKTELQKLHTDSKLKLRETTESYINIINNKNDELRKGKASYEAELCRLKASREAQKKRFDGDLNKEIAVTKFMSASIFKLKDRLESERKKAKRIATFYYIFTMLSLIQAGLWLL